MISLQAILLLLTLISAGCNASPLLHQSSFAKHIRKKHSIVSSSTARQQHTRSVAFMVIPRGGGDEDGLDNDYLEESSDSIDEIEDSEEEYDIIEGDVDDEDDDGELDSTSIDGDDDTPFSPYKFSFFLSSSNHQSSLTSTVIHYASILIRVTKRACRAGARAVLHNDSNDDEEEDHGRLDNKPVVHTLLGRTAYVLGEMYHAALTPDDDGEESVVETTLRIGQDNDVERGKKHKKRSRKRRKHKRRNKKQHEHTTNPTTILCNGGGIDDEHAILDLAKQYNINLPTNNDHNQLSKKYTNTILLSSQTSLNDALAMANSNARFLLCYISKQSNRKNNDIVIPNLLSQDVIKMANRKPLGKKQMGTTASYYIWITNNDKDVELAMKRLKVKLPSKKSNSKSTGVSILTIIYPSTTIDPTSSKLKVSPRLLTQHHCNPPPSTSESFIQWMNTIRKRHLKEYNKLQYTVREMELLKERNAGYVTSINEDTEREKKEEIEKQRKKEEEMKEQKRLQNILLRRKELLASLVDEPPIGSEGSIITIALRFTDSNKTRDRTTLQRRFDSKSTTTNDVCNWIDAVHGIERERIELSTMNGSKKFVYVEDDNDGEKNVTLEEAGLGKMTALRVSEIVVDDDNAEEERGEESGEEEESEYEDESGEE